MKILAPALLLCCTPLMAQIRVGESEQRKESRELLIEIYRRPDVEEACKANPDKLVTVTINGREFSVNCRVRAEVLELIGGQ